jgi:hypothetical protein
MNNFMASVRKTSVPHDESYKNLFSHPEMVESLIRDFVPEEWVRETESVREAFGALKKLLANKKYQALNRAFAVWIIRVLQNRKMLKEPIPEINDIEEVDAVFAESVDEWTKQWK